MRYKLLGKSGLRVSELCLGAMTFGTDWLLRPAVLVIGALGILALYYSMRLQREVKR